MLVLQYEQCVRDPVRQMARTYSFLGLPPHELSTEQLARLRNRTRTAKVPLEPSRRELLVDLY